jgi:hypothetical protein
MASCPFSSCTSKLLVSASNTAMFYANIHLDIEGGIQCAVCYAVYYTWAWIRWLTISLSAWMSKFNARLLQMGFVIDKVSMRSIFLCVFQFYPVSIIPPVLHNHSPITDIIRNCEYHYITKKYYIPCNTGAYVYFSILHTSLFCIICDILY